MTRAQPLLEVREIQATQQKSIDGIAEKHLCEGVLTVGRVKELLHGLFSEVEQLLTGHARLVILDLFLEPSEIQLPRSGVRCCHRLKHYVQQRIRTRLFIVRTCARSPGCVALS